MDKKYDVCLLSLFFAPNHGSVLVSFACERLIETLGYSVLMLQKPRDTWNEWIYSKRNAVPQDFAKRHYNISDIYNNSIELMDLNNYCEQFVVGSDQVFNPGLRLEYVFLEWVTNGKNKIAFGTSFGRDNFLASPDVIATKQYLLDRFNHVALREKSERLCNHVFKLDAVEIIDPTLILPLEEYEKLARNVDMKIREPYLLTYTLDLSEEKAKAIKYIADKLNLTLINIRNLSPGERKAQNSLVYVRDYTPEEFIYLYQHASFVVTDSYHGTCFSVKFNKPFISFFNGKRGGFRYKVFDFLRVSERVVKDIGNVYNRSELLTGIDYSNTNKIIQEKSDYAIKWLEHALKTNSSPQKYTHFENYIDAKLKKMASEQYLASANDEADVKGEIDRAHLMCEKKLKYEIDRAYTEYKKELKSGIESVQNGYREELKDGIENVQTGYRKELRDGMESVRTGYREELRSGIERAQTKYKRELKSEAELVRSVLREIFLLPITWCNLQRCRLASHIFFGKPGRHYSAKKRMLKARVSAVRNYLRD